MKIFRAEHIGLNKTSQGNLESLNHYIASTKVQQEVLLVNP